MIWPACIMRAMIANSGLDDLMPCENTIAGLGDCKPAYEKVCPCCGETIYVSCDQLHAKAVKR